MGALHQLDTLRSEAAGCVLVAYADLRTKLVLDVSTETSRPQEALDELCFQAANCFDDLDFMTAKIKDDTITKPNSTHAIVMTPNEVRVFVRVQNAETEFLCCICETYDQIDVLSDAARLALQEISGGA